MPGQQQYPPPYNPPPQPPPYQQPPYQGPPPQPWSPYPPDRLAQYQPVRVPARRLPPRPRRRSTGCCVFWLLAFASLGILVIALAAAYLLMPFHTNLLVLGIDRPPEGTALSRTDTMILMSVDPLGPEVKMLSIPRDLWVNIPGVGENRINTAHFFAEANQPGSGPAAVEQTVEQNFGVPIDYYVRLRFDAVMRIVDAMGGVNVDLPDDMAGLPAGRHHLDGKQALAFVRDRKGTDDFFRMEHGQFMLKAIALQAVSPLTWPRLPLVANAAISSIDTNLPFWQWPRLGFAFIRAVMTNHLDSRTIQREMTTPYITDAGADVLLPDWDMIHSMVMEMFSQ